MIPRRFRRDIRAQSLGMSNFVLGLVAGAIVFYYCVTLIGGDLATRVAGDGGEIGTRGTQYMNVSGDLLIAAFMLVSIFGLLLYSVQQRRGA